MKKLLLALAFCLAASAASAQCSGVFTTGTVCGNATGASTTPRMTPYNSFIPYTNLTQYHFFIGNASNKATDTAIAGDCTYGASGLICTKTNGVTFGYFATGTSAANLTGTLPCGVLPAFTTDVTNSGCALTIANNAVTNAKLAQAVANTVKGNGTGSTANVTDLAMPSCSSASSALIWTSNTGFGCNTTGTGLPAGFTAPAVVADGQFITNGSITNGASTLTSASNPFVVGDVGKVIQCGGSGAAGAVQSGTISSYNSAGSVVVSFTASTTVTGAAVCQWGTDNTTVINNAITALTRGGTVLLPTGYILVSSVNLTNTLSVGIQGASCGINGTGHGTVLVPTNNNSHRAVVDMTGAQGGSLTCIQINTTRSPVSPGAAVLLAGSNSAVCTLFTLDHVFITGHFQAPALYIYGCQDSEARHTETWNYNETYYAQPPGQIAVYVSRDNGFSMASTYTTIATGDVAAGNIMFTHSEMHDFKPGGGTTSGAAFDCRGCAATTIIHALLDSSSTVGITVFEQATGGTSPNRNMFINSTWYNENGTASAACIDVPTASSTNMTILAGSFTCTAPRVGTTTYVGLQTP